MLFEVFKTPSLAGFEDTVDCDVLIGRNNIIYTLDDSGMVQASQNVKRPDQTSVFIMFFKLASIELLQCIFFLYISARLLVTLLRMRKTFPKVPSPNTRTHSKCFTSISNLSPSSFSFSFENIDII